MIAMQYSIILSDDYDMDIIKKRVANNGTKTDGFTDLFFKLYLITEKADGAQNNMYAPLYVWKHTKGMNKFIFEGFYDNILSSFGWQNIHIAITQQCEIQDRFQYARYAVEIKHHILPMKQMEMMCFSMPLTKSCVGRMIIYNPDTWTYREYYFYETLQTHLTSSILYKILHISM